MVRVTKNGFLVNEYDEVFSLDNSYFYYGTPWGKVKVQLDYK